MKRSFLFVLALFIGQIVFSQQRSAYELISENPDRAACNMHSYEFPDYIDTRVPRGFKPVYISHYGRHGSRYDVSSSMSNLAISSLQHIDSLGQLTHQGKQLLKALQTIACEHEGMAGELAPRGGREQSRLAARMAERYPRVFRSGGEVCAVASTVGRCLVSMACFTTALGQAFPSLEFHLTSGDRYAPVIRLSPSAKPLAVSPKTGPKQQHNETRHAQPLQGNFSAFLSSVFVKPDVLGDDSDDFIRSVYRAGGICQDLDFLGIDVFRSFFTTDELYSLWCEENDAIYRRWGNSLEDGARIARQALPLLRDIVIRADQSLAQGSSTVVDLRFGHDMGYLALCALLGIDQCYPSTEAHLHWYSFQTVPMCANVQFIFYRNNRGEVIFKVLRGEQEVLLPSIRPFSAPYYRWDDFKTHFNMN